MGILGKVLLAPLAPVYGVMWLAEQLERIADDELHGSESIQRDLLELQIAHDEGSIDEAAYEDAVYALIERMQALPGAGMGMDP